MSLVDAEYLGIVTTEAHGVYEHKFKRADHQPGPDDIVAEVAYSGLNHIDVSQQESGAYIPAYPYILGKEWSGEVVQVGSNVNDLKVGQKVMGLGYTTGGLQQFITLSRSHICLVPPSLSLEQAATVAHRYAAIMVALFFQDGLNLPLEPSAEDKKSKQIIIWGAATGSGMFAVQILKALGYETIIAVASPKQHAKLLRIGASEVFDRSDAGLAAKIRPKYPHLDLGLVAQADPAGWQTLIDITKSSPEAPKSGVTIVHIIRRAPPSVPPEFTLKRTVAFSIMTDPKGELVIAKYLPLLMSSPNFALPKEVQVVSDGTLLEKVKSSLKTAEENTEVSLAIKVK